MTTPFWGQKSGFVVLYFFHFGPQHFCWVQTLWGLVRRCGMRMQFSVIFVMTCLWRLGDVVAPPARVLGQTRVIIWWQWKDR